MEEKYKIHAYYILSILVAIILVLITVKWTEIPKLFEYLSFSLTLSSLILAFLDIIYAFYSNSSLQKNIATFEGTSRNIEDKARTITDAVVRMVSKFETIPTIMENVQTRVEETHALIIDSQQKTSGFPAISPRELIIPAEMLDNFINLTSTAGLRAIYICKRSLMTQKSFSIEELGKQLIITKADYIYGYIIAVGGFNLILYDNKSGVITVKDMHIKLLEKVEDLLAERKGAYTQPEWIANDNKEKEIIDAYFA